MQLSLFRANPLAEALRPLQGTVTPGPDAPTMLAELIDLRGGVELAERLDLDRTVPPPAEPELRRIVVAQVRARLVEEGHLVQGRLDEAYTHALRPRYRLPGAQRAFQVLHQAGALEARKGAPLKTAIRTLQAPCNEFLETHLKRARFALRALRDELKAELLTLGGEAAALTRLEDTLNHALHARTEALFHRAMRAAEDHLGAAFATWVRRLPTPAAEADLEAGFHPQTGEIIQAFYNARGLYAALFTHERQALERLVEAACAAAEPVGRPTPRS